MRQMHEKNQPLKMIIKVSSQNKFPSKNVFVPLFQAELPSLQKDVLFYLPPDIQKIALDFARKNFRGEEGEIKYIWLSSKKIERITFLGLGERNKWNTAKSQMAARRAAGFAKNEKMEDFSFYLREEFGENYKESSKIFALNFLLADFEFSRYKKPSAKAKPVKNVFLCSTEENLKDLKQGSEEGKIIGEETNGCRALANSPGGDITPVGLAQEARLVALKNKISVKILDEKDMKKIGMGGVLGVSKGSSEKPRFIIMEYRGVNPPAGGPPLALVGKGVTFDTGGLNLKPEQGIYEMHMDMSGGAAVIHGLAAIARLKLPLNVVGLVPAVENSTSGSSYRPGDILKSLSGKTIEVLNTDAEGRIILADALTYSLRWKPGFILDIATLTGAAMVALGNHCSALFTNRDKLQKKLFEIGKDSGDKVWPLPLWEEYGEEIKGTFADIANVGKVRWGGAIHGAKFLESFTENTPWAHLDIAPKMTTNDAEALTKGASGAGVRYIVELAKRYEEIINV